MHRLEQKRVWLSEYWLVLVAWSVYAAAETLFFPVFAPEDWGIQLEAKSVFVSLYQAVIAFVIAFPLADAQLKKQRYAAFIAISLAILTASSLLFEFVIDPLFFGGKLIPAATYLHLVESTTIALLFVAVRLLANRRRSERRLIELEKANIEAELQYLKAQMNPHFLFNALNNIYSHALDKSKKTPDLILKLADMLRYMIYDCADNEVSLEKEIAFLSDYIGIQRMALEGRGSVDFQLKGEVEGKRIAPFLLIPFVENCFKHSLDGLERGIDIKIVLDASQGRLQLDCSNIFDPQFNNKAAFESAGIGLANVKRRLQLLFEDDFELSASAQGQRYCVMLNVPVQS